MLGFNKQKYSENLLEYSQKEFIEWNIFKNKTILVTGANGLIGRFLVDLIMYKNINEKLNCKVLAVARNKKSTESVFSNYVKNKMFSVVCSDVTKPLSVKEKIDFVVHTASNSNPSQYSKDPIGTIKTNVLGTMNILDLCVEKKVRKMIFLSTFEVYGTVKSKKRKILESDYGFVDCVIPRSCYPESKRVSESLCVAYSKQKNINTTILRLSRVFGPTMKLDSSLSIASFIKNGIKKEDIVLKSDGQQLYSFNYVGDVATAILVSITQGEDGGVYNLSDNKFDSRLIDFVNYVSSYTGVNVLFDNCTIDEKQIYSNTVMSILDSSRIKKLGWHVDKNLNMRIIETIDILRGHNT